MSTLPCRIKGSRGNLPLGITSFKCPKCKEPIPLSLLSEKSNHQEVDSDTILVTPVKTGIGRLTVLPDADTPEQAFPLHEGKVVIGRKSNASQATMPIITADRTMSREHICIEVKKIQKVDINISLPTIIVKTIRYIITVT